MTTVFYGTVSSVIVTKATVSHGLASSVIVTKATVSHGPVSSVIVTMATVTTGTVAMATMSVCFVVNTTALYVKETRTSSHIRADSFSTVFQKYRNNIIHTEVRDGKSDKKIGIEQNR